jgi:hypothetical protein
MVSPSGTRGAGSEVAPRSGTVFGGVKLEGRLLVVLYQAGKGSVCCWGDVPLSVEILEAVVAH